MQTAIVATELQHAKVKHWLAVWVCDLHHRDRIEIKTPVGRTDHFFQGHRAEDDKLLFVARIEDERS